MTDPLTVTQAAALIGIHRDTARQLILGGRIHATKVGSVWLVERVEAERYRDSDRRPGRRPAVPR